MGYLITFQTDGHEIEIIGWSGPITETREMARKVGLLLGAVAYRITDLTTGEEGHDPRTDLHLCLDAKVT